MPNSPLQIKAIAAAVENLNGVENRSEDEFLFLGEGSWEINDPWIAHIGSNGHNTKFKLDTVASVCVLREGVKPSSNPIHPTMSSLRFFYR